MGGKLRLFWVPSKYFLYAENTFFFARGILFRQIVPKQGGFARDSLELQLDCHPSAFAIPVCLIPHNVIRSPSIVFLYDTALKLRKLCFAGELPIDKWTPTEVAVWLRKIGFTRVSVFRKIDQYGSDTVRVMLYTYD